MSKTTTIDVPAGFDHRASIYEKADGIGFSEPLYNILLPGEFRHIYASSKRQPIIVVGDGGTRHGIEWQFTIGRAQRWQFPLNKLLTNRPLKVAYQTFTVPDQRVSTRKAHAVVGVQILGDLSKCELLEAHVDEVRGWFA